MNSAPPEPGRAHLITDATGAQRLIGWTTDLGHRDGRPRLYLDLGAQHGNRHGVLHGGIIAMLLDSACGYAGARHLDPVALPELLTLSFTTQFLAPVAGGRVTALGTVTGGGRRTLFIAGELFDEDGRLAATSTGVYRPVAKETRK
ncbi:PaaI family thioesterase [Pseudooceanicola lipolyticus]|uniref:PaaI family thioesterase n=1 Tax=Pseudooceanicola lipolyticus TaxID=2029104 RepID=A0A2M8IVA6_9RHOB|nr:PaaI family thioesterase [Pseudooceanicola lipolyticus]PJE34462.1 PaaI family thioesterase [Pseudooceanicola lipolyticus]